MRARTPSIWIQVLVYCIYIIYYYVYLVVIVLVYIHTNTEWKTLVVDVGIPELTYKFVSLLGQKNLRVHTVYN
jgi:hypothetical protein